MLDFTERQFRLVLEHVPMPMLVHDETGKVRFLSNEFLRLTGYAREQIPTFRAWLELAFDDPATIERVLRSHRENYGGEARNLPQSGEYRIRVADGSKRLWLFRAYSIGRDDDGLAVDVSMAFDITESRAVTDAFARSEAELQQALRVGGLGRFERDFRSRKVAYSRELAAAHGFGEGERGESYEQWFQRVHPDDRDRVIAYAQALERPEPENAIEYRVARRGDGVYRRVLEHCEPLRDGSGQAIGSAGVQRDVTEARATEQALRDSEARLRLAAEVGEFGACEYDVRADVLFWDARLRAIWGYGLEEPMTFRDYCAGIHPDDRKRLSEVHKRVLDPAGDGRCETEYRAVNRRDGRVRTVLARGRMYFEGGRPTRIVCVITDVTEARAAEQALRESEARLRMAAEIGRIGTFETDLINNRVHWDARVRAIWGYDPDEPLTPDHYLKGIHLDDREVMRRMHERLYDPAGDGLCTGEYRVVNAKDGRVRFVAARGRMIFENGRPARIIGALIDVTAQRDARAELERQVEARTRELAEAQTRLAHAQRMESLGQLAGGIAHDFNNVLQAIEAAGDLIERKSDLQNLPRYLRMLREGTKRGSAISRRLSSLSRRPELEPEAAATAGLIEDLAGVLSHVVEAGVTVETQIAPDCPPLFADRRLLETALLNIAGNAREAMDGAGVLKLSARRESARAAAESPFRAKLAPGDYVRIEIRDNGPGMTAEVRARAAEPFFSTKPRGQGVGLGLAMARGFAEQSGGALAIDSAPGAGTAVALWLPVAAAAQAENCACDAGQRGQLLLVDDDPLVRELVGEHLREAGYRVTACEEGRAALSHLDAGATFDLLLTDFAMPQMNGVTLAREARRRRPELPVIVLTGYSSEAADAAGANSDFRLLRKPIVSAQLISHVAELIAKS